MTASQLAAIGFGPIATALIIFGLVVVRGTKISEFRQAWINDQRADLGKLIANARRLQHGGGSKSDDYWLAFDDAFTRISLRKNPEKKWWRPRAPDEWQDVLDQMNALRRLLENLPIDKTGFNDRITNIERLSRVWLKREWKRTRAGELGYRLLILVALLFIFWTDLPLISLLIVKLANAVGVVHVDTSGWNMSDFIANSTKG